MYSVLPNPQTTTGSFPIVSVGVLTSESRVPKNMSFHTKSEEEVLEKISTGVV